MGNRKVAFVEMTVPKLAASVEVNLSSRAKAIAFTVSRHGAAGQTSRHFGARYVRQNSSQGTSFSSDDASFYWTMYIELVRNRSIIPRYRKVVVLSAHTAENHDFISSDQGSKSSTSKSLFRSARSGNMLSR